MPKKKPYSILGSLPSKSVIDAFVSPVFEEMMTTARKLADAMRKEREEAHARNIGIMERYAQALLAKYPENSPEWKAGETALIELEHVRKEPENTDRYFTLKTLLEIAERPQPNRLTAKQDMILFYLHPDNRTEDNMMADTLTWLLNCERSTFFEHLRPLQRRGLVKNDKGHWGYYLPNNLPRKK